MGSFEKRKRNDGFTPIEVLVVLIIIGIISVIIIGRSNMGPPNLTARSEVIKSHIRYAQARAMNSSISWGIQCNDSGQTYWLFVDGQPIDEKRMLPGEESDTVDLRIDKVSLTPVTLSFDDRGRPCSDANGQALRENDLSLTLSADGGAATTITITRNTGFIP